MDSKCYLTQQPGIPRSRDWYPPAGGPENCHGSGFKLRADSRVRVHEPLQICLVKNRDKLIKHTVRVRFSCYIWISGYLQNHQSKFCFFIL